MSASLKQWLASRRDLRNHSPWGVEELSRLKAEVQASTKRNLRLRRRTRRLRRSLTW